MRRLILIIDGAVNTNFDDFRFAFSLPPGGNVDIARHAQTAIGAYRLVVDADVVADVWTSSDGLYGATNLGRATQWRNSDFEVQ